MPSVLSSHAFWVVQEGEDLFLVEVDVAAVQFIIWSTQARPAVTYWIRCAIAIMMPPAVQIHTGWRVVTECRFPLVGLTSATAVLMTTLSRHLQHVPEVPAPDLSDSRRVMLCVFGHLADNFA